MLKNNNKTLIMTSKNKFLFTLLLFSTLGFSQDWMLKLSSTVELRTWRLTSVADKSEKSLPGAEIKLYKNTTLIGQTTSDPSGDFSIDIPAGGDFILTISYAGCNSKKFNVSTSGVDEKVGKDNYKPTVNISGFLMSKPLKGVDYIGLNEPLVKVEYKSKGQNFDKDDAVTNKGLGILSKIYDAETSLIQRFCAANKAGDDAMKNHNCPAAKEHYSKATEMLPGETYPIEQLSKVELCLKNKKAEAEAAAAETAEKAAASKIANEKLIAEKQAKDKELFEKAANDRSEKEKMKNEKESKNKTASVKTETTSPDKIKINETEPTTSESSPKKGHSSYSLAQPIGKNPYKETIGRADDFFKMKRYKEAKAEYEKALKIKSDDAYSKSKLEEIVKLSEPK
jgi:hypothetical protein